MTTSGSGAIALSKTGALPGGVTFTDNGNGTATLAGTPDVGSGGTYPVTITATNNLGSDHQVFTLTVSGSGNGGGGGPGSSDTPELASLLLFGSGLTSLLAYARTRRRAARGRTTLR